MKKPDVYRRLEEKMLAYQDYVDIPVKPNSDPLVPIPATASLTARQIDREMLKFTGDKVYVRRTLLGKLQVAAELLACLEEPLQLEVVYGYRTLEIQQRLFNKYKTQLQNQYSGEDLIAAVHRLVAVPEAAGHPAGAAVDIQILKRGEVLDFGTKIHEFIPDTYVFSPFISPLAWSNRQLLRRVMMSAGFAPFDGEWWHFSYGDKEWARYYGLPTAIYEQLTASQLPAH